MTARIPLPMPTITDAEWLTTLPAGPLWFGIAICAGIVLAFVVAALGAREHGGWRNT